MFALSVTVASALLLRAVSAKTVFAHFMVQNAYAYDVGQWETDIAAAQQIGVDGFALNWIPPDCESGMDWMVEAIDDAWTAAENKGFQLMYSFDMSYSSCNTYWNTTFMQTMISNYADSSAAYRWNDDLLVSTYGGDQVSEYGNDFFQSLKDTMADSNPICLVPALTEYSMAAQYTPTTSASAVFSDFPAIDGYLNWQAWPLNTDANITVTPDEAFMSALSSASKSGPYIMAVSPWQYKDLNDGNPLDSWVAYSDTLFPDRFDSLVNNDVQPDIIELLTWNDFTESHYLRDLPSETDTSATDYIVLDDMGAYVWGQNHAPWRIIAKYYISWWKNGSPPAITEDQVVFWHRNYPKATVCTGGSGEPIRNYQDPEDAVFAWALVSESSTISMTVGSNQYWTFEADGSGPSQGFVPFPSSIGSGVTPSVAIMRNGQTIASASSSQTITTDCPYQNFNPVVTLVGSGINSGVGNGTS